MQIARLIRMIDPPIRTDHLDPYLLEAYIPMGKVMVDTATMMGRTA